MASTTFSQNNKREQPVAQMYRRTLSVSSLRGSICDPNEDHCRISLNTTAAEEEMFEVSEVTLTNLSEKDVEKLHKKKMFAGSYVHVERYTGSYLSMKKRLYYANRLQMTSNPAIQPIYAYSMVEINLNEWSLCFVTDRKYKKLRDVRL